MQVFFTLPVCVNPTLSRRTEAATVWADRASPATAGFEKRLAHANTSGIIACDAPTRQVRPLCVEVSSDSAEPSLDSSASEPTCSPLS